MLKHSTVGEWMTKFPKTVSAESSILEVEELMRVFEIRHLPVVNTSGVVLGTISKETLDTLSLLKDPSSLNARLVMNNEHHIIREETSLEDVVSQMARLKHDHVLVSDTSNKVVGIFTSTDALKILATLFAEAGGPETLKIKDDFPGYDNNCGL